MTEQETRVSVNGIFSSGARLANFYTFLIHNPNISFWSAMQILSIRPSMTICKTFDEWQDVNRVPKRGERGVCYFDENKPGVKTFVFDIAQTYGKEKYKPAIYKMGRSNVASCVNSQNIWLGLSSDTDTLKGAVFQYCQEHYGYGEDEEYDNKYLSCLTEGITQCLCALTGNKGIEVQPLSFDEDTNFKLCREVVEMYEGLKEIVVEVYERQEQLKQAREAAKARKRQFSFEEERSSGQLTLWDFASGVSQGELPSAISDLVIDESATPAFGTDSARGGTYAGDFNGEDLSQIVIGLPDEFAGSANSGESGGRNGFSGSSFPRPRNYRLTDENFEYATGAKTRYKQNIEAIKKMKELLAEGKAASEEDKKILSKYVGWGGLANAFDPDKPDWKKEYDELRDLLTFDEYQQARETVLSAHYTPKKIIDGVYAGIKQLGMRRGKILEPAMGIGNFIGLLPNSFQAKETYGVEIDTVTGNIAKLLYPETRIKICGFEKTNFANNSFDAVITNVPFGNFKVNDEEYNRLNFNIHNYFFAKSLDKVRPGGIIAAITSKGTMDRAHPEVRQYIANRAVLLGAIRLPNNAFKVSAGTEVTSDILFFQKRDKIVDKAKDSWINVEENADGISINQYFIDHPEMMLGKMVKQKSMYGSDDETALLPDDRDLGQALAEAVSNLPMMVFDERKNVPTGDDVAEAEIEVGEEHANVKDYCYTFVGNKLYQRIKDKLVACDLARTNVERMKGLIGIRKRVREVLQVQLDNCPDEILQNKQRDLNREYDSFVRKYGIVNTQLNRRLFRDDADFALLISIENVDDKTGRAKKTDVFSKRTIKPYQKVTHCETAMDALNVCKSEKGVVDLQYMEQLTGKLFEELVEELGTQIYRNPTKAVLDEGDKYLGWETASEYLSGNVREKLEQAEMYAEKDEQYQRNVAALKEAQPAPLTASEISAKLGVNWIDDQYYKDFICETLGVGHWGARNVHVEYCTLTGEYKVKRPPHLGREVNANSVYGTGRMDAYEILERCLNQQTPTITDEVEEFGQKRRVTNREETIAARERQRKMQNAFKKWIFDDPERREYLVEKYNRMFNNTVVPTFDGSYLSFPGMNPEIELKPHQKDAVARMMQGKNTLLHHCVGAGKTYEIAAACMKMKEIGLVQKPLIVVPNHLVVQWANEFRKLYANANVLMATKKDLEKTSRKRFVAKVATGDWDAVIIAMSSFEKIPISQERQRERLYNEIQMIEEGIREAADHITVKNLERTLKNKKAQMEKMMAAGKKDDLLNFEDLGVDAIFVDEAHKYKNKFLFTKMTNVSGISRAMSQRATDMDLKCEYINEMRGGDKGVVFATGTPISNSLVEMYTMQTYLQRSELYKCGLQYFDTWAANFTETVTGLELAPSGQGYRSKTRVAKFTNLPELLKMYRSFADVKTAEMLNLPVPDVEKIIMEVEPTDDIVALNDDIVERADKIANKMVEPWEDNMLCITHDGKMIALDPRCYDKSIPDNPNTKLNRVIDKIFSVWQETAEQRSTQLVFCDMSTPKKSFHEYDPVNDFDVYNDIKLKLVKLGVPEHEVAYIHEAKTDAAKESIFDGVRRGDIRVLIGSTEKCGAGTNIQDRLIALYHLDTPYRPSDLEQREGRIIRRGNMNEKVLVVTAVTKKTFDAYSYQILETKQRFIGQIDRGDYSLREASDIDETTLTYAEIKAITSDNPKIKRKMEIEQRLGQLSVLEKDYRNNRYYLQAKVQNIPKHIEKLVEEIEDIKEDIRLRDLHKDDLIQLGKNRYEERKEAGAILQTAVNSEEYVDKTIGFIRGFKIVPQRRTALGGVVNLVGAKRIYGVQLGDSGIGAITRIENALDELEARIKNRETEITENEKSLEDAKAAVDLPFEQAEELESLQNELSEIDAELDLSKQETPIVLDEPDGGKMELEILDEEEEEVEIA